MELGCYCPKSWEMFTIAFRTPHSNETHEQDLKVRKHMKGNFCITWDLCREIFFVVVCSKLHRLKVELPYLLDRVREARCTRSMLCNWLGGMIWGTGTRCCGATISWNRCGWRDQQIHSKHTHDGRLRNKNAGGRQYAVRVLRALWVPLVNVDRTDGPRISDRVPILHRRLTWVAEICLITFVTT